MISDRFSEHFKRFSSVQWIEERYWYDQVSMQFYGFQNQQSVTQQQKHTDKGFVVCTPAMCNSNVMVQASLGFTA